MRWLLLALATTTSATTRLTRPAAKQAFFVLKRGHSGSTWLSALLLNLPLTYFFDELVGASANFDAKKLEAIFVQALRAPTGRGTSPEWSKSSGDPAVRVLEEPRDLPAECDRLFLLSAVKRSSKTAAGHRQHTAGRRRKNAGQAYIIPADERRQAVAGGQRRQDGSQNSWGPSAAVAT